jgi:Leucine-rich repeat (LRR) protein
MFSALVCLLFALRCYHSISVPVPTLSSSQYNALYVLYNETNGNDWTWVNVSSYSKPWDFTDEDADVNPCLDFWQGIECVCLLSKCDITVLTLNVHNLTGRIPSAVGDLTELVILDLRGNHLTSSLPNSFGNLTQLISLDLSLNRLTGIVPASFSFLTNLKSLVLDYNNFVNIASEAFDGMTSLEMLSMVDNEKWFTALSPNIGNLTALRVLFLTGNAILYEIPSTLGNLRNLEYLDLSKNYFESTVPESIYSLSNLSSLILVSNFLTGTISPSISQLTKLEGLFFSQNKFVGSLPNDISELIHLGILSLDNCLYTGRIPNSYSKLTNLSGLYLEGNSFHGNVSFLSTLTKLKLFQMNNNFLASSSSNSDLPSSSLSQIFYNLSRLTQFDLSNNLFSGSIPYSPNWENSIGIYEIYDNYFSNRIPSDFTNLSLLRYFIVANNYLTGPLDALTFSNCPALQYLTVSNNRLSGFLPTTIGNHPKLDQLYLNGNAFTGTLPTEIGNLHNLVILSIYDNSFTGTIPMILSQLTFLEEIFLQSNSLIGSFNNFFNFSVTPPQRSHIINLDFSNNQLTGSLPVEFFEGNTALQSFTVASNCLTGSIPMEMCQAIALTSLSLDGLATAENCRNYLFPGFSSYLNAFTLKHYVSGNIPTCLFNSMSSLTLLHVGGNGFTGSLSSLTNISSSLTDLSLSYNQLTGTIPMVIQNRSWTNLDLSYNRLTGTLFSSIPSISADAALTLQVNRLSGAIPSSLFAARNISILNGNLFSCDFQETNLPSHDSDYEEYSCGSSTVNDLIYSWLLLIVILPVIVFFILYDRTVPSFWKHWEKRLIEWKNNLSSNVKLTNLLRLEVFYQELRRQFGCFCLFCLFVLLPIYIVLKEYSSSAAYSNEYAWTVSGMLLCGETAAFTLFSIWFFIPVWVIYSMKCISDEMNRIPLVESTSKEQKEKQSIATTTAVNNEASSLPVSSSDLLSTSPVTSPVISVDFVVFESSNSLRDTIQLQPDKLNNKPPKSMISSSSWYDISLVYFLVFWSDLIIMSIVDFSYVYIVTTYGSLGVILATISLAVFRIVANNILVWIAIPFLTRRLAWLGLLSQEVIAVWKEKQSSAFKDYAPLDMSFLETLTLVNNLVIPALAIIFILPDCFYNALFAPSPVSSSYEYTSCDQYAVELGKERICFPNVQEISYSPPYIYSYQCSSKIVMYYVPVYVIMFGILGIFLPFLYLLLKLWYDSLHSSLQTNGNIKSNGWKIRVYLLIHDLLPPPLRTLTSSPPSLQEDEESLGRKSYLPSFLSRLTLGVGGRREENEKEKSKGSENGLIFSRLKLSLQINSYLAIFVSFGVLFPPLALIVLLSILTSTLFEELSLGYVLCESRKLGYDWYEKQINNDCKGVDRSLHLTLWSTFSLTCACALYGYVIFDTMGDTNGWKEALPLTLVMIILPSLLYLTTRCYGKREQLFKLKSFGQNTAQNESVSPSVGKTQATEKNDNKVLDRDMTEPAKDFSIDSRQTRESRVKSRMISMEIDLERNGYTNNSNEEEKNEVDVSNRTNRSQTLSSRIRSVSSVFNPLVVVKSNEQFETSSMNDNSSF